MGLVSLLRILETESVMERHQVKYLQIPCGRRQRAVKIVHHAVQVINGGEVLPQRLYEPGLERLVLLLEYLHRLRGQNPAGGKRKVPGHHLTHPFTDGQDLFVRNALSPKLAVVTAGQGMVDLEFAVREKLTHSRLGQETQRTDINPPALCMVKADELHPVRIKHREVQGFELMVHQRGQHGELLAAAQVYHRLGGDDRQGLPLLQLIVPAVVDAGDGNQFHRL